MTWQDEMHAAYRANREQVPLWTPVPLHLGPRAAADAAARLWRREVPYRFEGEHHQIRSYRGCVGRQFGACADAVAFVGAAAALAGGTVSACYELAEHDPDYAHVSLVVDGWGLDPLPEYAYQSRGCAGVIRFT